MSDDGEGDGDLLHLAVAPTAIERVLTDLHGVRALLALVVLLVSVNAIASMAALCVLTPLCIVLFSKW